MGACRRHAEPSGPRVSRRRRGYCLGRSRPPGSGASPRTIPIGLADRTLPSQNLLRQCRCGRTSRMAAAPNGRSGPRTMDHIPHIEVSGRTGKAPLPVPLLRGVAALFGGFNGGLGKGRGGRGNNSNRSTSHVPAFADRKANRGHAAHSRVSVPLGIVLLQRTIHRASVLQRRARAGSTPRKAPRARLRAPPLRGGMIVATFARARSAAERRCATDELTAKQTRWHPGR